MSIRNMPHWQELMLSKALGISFWELRQKELDKINKPNKGFYKEFKLFSNYKLIIKKEGKY